jgi:hypothetical protein
VREQHSLNWQTARVEPSIGESRVLTLEVALDSRPSPTWQDAVQRILKRMRDEPRRRPGAPEVQYYDGRLTATVESGDDDEVDRIRAALTELVNDANAAADRDLADEERAVTAKQEDDERRTDVAQRLTDQFRSDAD